MPVAKRTAPYSINVVSQLVVQPPNITSNPPQTATVGTSYAYDVKGSDPNNDPLTWSLDTAPQGMSIDPSLGTLRWTPTADELGSQPVVVRLTDSQGADATQSYAIIVSLVNLPPSISSVPPTTADTADTYTYAVAATDPQGLPLTFSLTTAPSGMAINANSGLITWSPTATQLGSQNVAIQVDDGQGGIATQSYAVVVTSTPPDQPPVITSTPSQLATVGQPYQYQVTASDHAGQKLTYVLLSNPTGMTIDANTGLVSWTPTASQLGSNAVVVGAVDPLGAGGSQSFAILVNPVNLPPVLDPIPDQSVTAGLQFLYDAHATDPGGNALFYSLTTAPSGMIIDGMGRIGWITTKANVGSSPITVTVTDALGATASQSFNLVVNPDTQAPVVNLLITPNPINVGQPATIIAQATDNVGVVSRALTINGVAVPLDAQGQATVLNLPGGTYTVVATATDDAGNVGSDTQTLVIIDNSDLNPPTVAITTPADGDTITQPVQVIGTASDANLVSYTLSVAPDGSNSFTQIASGTTSVTNGVLGTFDPSGLANGAYDLRLEATDIGGNVATIDETVNVSGNLKIGNFTLSFTDLSIPVSGIPVTLTRTYDSLNANNQDQLGYGWRLEYRDTDLTSSVHPTTPDEQEAGIFNPYLTGSKVYITLPGGQREGFTFEPQQKSGFEGYLGFYDPVFVPDPGVTDQLSVAKDYTLTQLDDGSWAGLVDDGELAFNPADSLNWGGIFNLTTKDGLAYQINANTGQLNSVSDANGNVVSFTDTSIDSNRGVHITFDLDPQGRIIAAHDPMGNTIHYQYDASGDLVSVTDRSGNVTTFVYDTRDRLLSRTDPDGTTISYTYDAAGNRTSVTIPAGTTTYTFDALNRTSTVTDPQGGVTTYTYDPVGDLTHTTFPNGTSETRRYDALNRLVYLEDDGPSGVISSYRYTLAKNGRRDAVVENTGRTVDYIYDALDRLTDEDITDAVNGNRTIHYVYDPVGNRLTMVDSAQGETDYTYNANDELLTATTGGVVTKYTYDNNGNTLSEYTSAVDQAIYEWDSQNRLIGAKVTDSSGTTNVSYQYNPAGIRVSSTVNGDETRYLIDANLPYAQVLEEYTPGGAIQVSYVYGNDLISQNRAGVKSFYAVDGLGSTRALTNSSGVVTDRYIYDAFGRTISQVGSTVNDYLFAGQQWDPNVGLDYLRARYYQAQAGRFFGMDPFVGLILNPATRHRYLYVENNPATLLDLSGKFTLTEVIVTSAIEGILRNISEVVFGTARIAATAIFANDLAPAFEAQQIALMAVAEGGDDADLALETYLLASENIALGFRIYRLGLGAISTTQDLTGIAVGIGNVARAFENISTTVKVPKGLPEALSDLSDTVASRLFDIGPSYYQAVGARFSAAETVAEETVNELSGIDDAVVRLTTTIIKILSFIDKTILAGSR